MEYVLSKYKIKKGQEKVLKDFLLRLNRVHQKEMAEVLAESKMTLDCSFIDGDHLYIFKRIEDHRLLNEKVAHSALPIYEEIRKWAHQVIESTEQLANVAAFDRIR
jgi:hypothetical protein